MCNFQILEEDISEYTLVTVGRLLAYIRRVRGFEKRKLIFITSKQFNEIML